MTKLPVLEPEFDIVEPYAPAMIESIRAVGYDLPMAIADLIDNSITANATRVDVLFEWDGETSCIAIIDDGMGMGEEKLVEAMRIGSTDPTDPRGENDLGRFGLGLKTASFSQCREFTVHTKRANGELATRRWSLDYVKQTKQWRVLRNGTHASEKFAAKLGASGTVVVWQSLDHLVKGTSVDSSRDRDTFYERAKQVEQHIGMVFHRYMKGPGRTRLSINGRDIEAWDPFLEDQEATQHPESQTLTLRGTPIKVDCFVLPHHSKLSSEEHSRAAGPRGWLSHQGFYIYRNRRLLVAGDWLDLGVRKEEHYKLARIRVDLTNTLDDLWQIDIKKSTAKVPVGIRRELAGIGRVTREKAVAIYRHRGKIINRAHGPRETFVWEQKVKHGKIFYRVNRDHPLVTQILDDAKSQRSAIRALIRLIEETVPVPLIVVNNAERPDESAAPFEAAPSAEIIAVLRELFTALIKSGLSEAKAIAKLREMEPFDRYPEYVETLPEILKEMAGE